MTTILLVRHGETDAAGKRLMGWAPGWHLDATGKQQVEQLAQKLRPLPIRAVYTSPLERALETAAPIAAGHGLAPLVVEDLGEVRVGSWEGLSFADLEQDPLWRRFNAFRADVRAPGGELMIETQARMVRRLLCLRQHHDGETVVVVSHGDPLRAAVAHFLQLPLDALLRFEISFASLSVLQLSDGPPRILCINQTGEIPI